MTGGIDAFALGIYSVNPDAKVYVKVTNSWYDPEAEEKLRHRRLLDMGCDVIAQHCDTGVSADAGPGAWRVQHRVQFGHEQGCAGGLPVQRGIWNWSAYYTAAVQSVIDGSWDGSNYYGGMNENLVESSRIWRISVRRARQEKVEEAKEADPYPGQNGVFDGVIETNTGETVGAKRAQTLDDATITGGINWYFKTVNVVD